MTQRKSSFGRTALAVVLLAGGFTALAGTAEAGDGFGFHGNFQGHGMVGGFPVHHGLARPFHVTQTAAIPGTAGPAPAVTPGFQGQGFVPPIAPGPQNEGFIPPIAPGPQNEGFIPPLVGIGFAHGSQFGFHQRTFSHHFAFQNHGFKHHFFRHRFAFRNRFGFRDHGFGSSFGGGFGFPFFDSFGYQPENVEPDIVVPESPSVLPPPVPSAEVAPNEGPVAAHAVHAHRGPLAEAPGDRHERVGQVVVIRPGYADEIVTVPAD